MEQFNIFCLLDNHGYSIEPHQHDFIAGVGVTDSIQTTDLRQLDEFLERNSTWKFGHLSYDLTYVLEGIPPSKTNAIGFPLLNFFVPQHVFILKGNELEIISSHPKKVYEEIISTPIITTPKHVKIEVKQKLTKQDYIKKINHLLDHIHRGDCYEINFCQEFFAENVHVKPTELYEKLMRVSPNPFSAFYKVNDSYLICGSPERFMMKEGDKILSQPMKGTAGRDLKDSAIDEALKKVLEFSAKEQAENVMIVDLVRNDLSKVCTDGTVKVDELFKIYSFPQVHQMISTISGELDPSVNFSDIVKATFPMGSMTGAPKRRVIELTDQYEVSSRGIYSGAVGYFTPEDDFDFNVVIRSLMYNKSTRYLSYHVGSGITFYSDPEKEWEECLLKAEGIKKVLTG